MSLKLDSPLGNNKQKECVFITFCKTRQRRTSDVLGILKSQSEHYENIEIRLKSGSSMFNIKFHQIYMAKRKCPKKYKGKN